MTPLLRMANRVYIETDAALSLPACQLLAQGIIFQVFLRNFVSKEASVMQKEIISSIALYIQSQENKHLDAIIRTIDGLGVAMEDEIEALRGRLKEEGKI